VAENAASSHKLIEAITEATQARGGLGYTTGAIMLTVGYDEINIAYQRQENTKQSSVLTVCFRFKTAT